MYFMGVFKNKRKPGLLGSVRKRSILDILRKKRGSFNADEYLKYKILNSEDGPKIKGVDNVQSDSNLKKDELYKINYTIKYDYEQEKKFSITIKEDTIIFDNTPSFGECSDETRDDKFLENTGYKDCNCNNNEWRCSTYSPKIEYIYNKDNNMIGVFMRQYPDIPLIIIDASLFE